MAGVRHELGVVSQRLRAAAAALKFRNNVLSLDGERHLVKRVYVGLRDERGRVGAGVVRNGVTVRGYLEPLAEAANWGAAVLGKDAVKSKAKQYVLAEQRRDLDFALRDRSTLALYATVASKGRSGLPEYLKRVCPSGLRPGRRLKTKFRLGAHPLRASSARMVRRDRRAAASRCECCNAGAEETIRHAMFECRAHDGIRTTFVERAEEVYPEFGHLSQDAS